VKSAEQSLKVRIEQSLKVRIKLLLPSTLYGVADKIALAINALPKP
jgi:hypothetical protein